MIYALVLYNWSLFLTILFFILDYPCLRTCYRYFLSLFPNVPLSWRTESVLHICLKDRRLKYGLTLQTVVIQPVKQRKRRILFLLDSPLILMFLCDICMHPLDFWVLRCHETMTFLLAQDFSVSAESFLYLERMSSCCVLVDLLVHESIVESQKSFLKATKQLLFGVWTRTLKKDIGYDRVIGIAEIWIDTGMPRVKHLQNSILFISGGKNLLIFISSGPGTKENRKRTHYTIHTTSIIHT